MTGEVSRRTVLQGTAAVGMAAGAWGCGIPEARATATSQPVDPYEEGVRDARMVWDRLPEDWRSAPLLGNGSLMVHVYRAPPADSLTFALVTKGATCREPSAQLVLALPGTPTAVRWELDLWNAELIGTVTTTRGTVGFVALVHRERGALLVSLTPHSGAAALTWSLKKAPGLGQDLAWDERRSGTRQLLAAAVGTTTVRRALSDDTGTLLAGHRAQWHRHYTRSLVSLPDRTAQRFHWTQLYQAASAMRDGAAVTGTGHPFLGTANHLALDPVVQHLEHGGRTPSHSHLAGALPGVGSKGGRALNPVAAWGLPAVASAYRKSGDERILREWLHPALRKAVEFYDHFLTTGADGGLRFPATHSPDYADAADCTYDLAMLRWALGALLDSTRRLRADERHEKRWREISERLVPYHTDSSGVMIGAGVRLATSHRHASHLMWLHPLREGALDDAARATARRSFDHWSAMREAWHGSSYVTAASLAAALRAPDESLAHLRHFLDGHSAAGTELTPNAMYGGEPGTEISVPLDAGQALLDMLLDGRGGVVEVFPAAPDAWQDISLAALRASGAFLVDAARTAGRTDWVRVHSEAGEPLVLRHGIPGPVDVRDERGRPLRWREHDPRTVAVELERGHSAVVTRRGNRPEPAPRQVPASGSGRVWGLPGQSKV